MYDSQLCKTRSQIAEKAAVREMLFHLPFHRSERKCWLWPKYRSDKGYGVIMFDGFKFRVHQLSFRHFKGLIPNEFVVMHECDEPACWNPSHLFLGTTQENMQDMARKGRDRNATRS